MKVRNAQCLCGQLKLRLEGEPKFSMVCHCGNCQHQTGSAFRYAVYCKEDSIAVEGKIQTYRYSSDSGRAITLQFCPQCGTSVFWRAEFAKGLVGVAGGCFAERDFPPPKNSVWNDKKLPWVELPNSWAHHKTQP